jgi:hypothetical protein
MRSRAYLDEAPATEPRLDERLGNPACSVRSRTVHLRRVLAGEGSASVRSPAAVRVHDDLASRQTSVALGSHKPQTWAINRLRSLLHCVGFELITRFSGLNSLKTIPPMLIHKSKWLGSHSPPSCNDFEPLGFAGIQFYSHAHVHSQDWSGSSVSWTNN